MENKIRNTFREEKEMEVCCKTASFMECHQDLLQMSEKLQLEELEMDLLLQTLAASAEQTDVCPCGFAAWKFHDQNLSGLPSPA